MNIRPATLADASAVQAIYAPIVLGTPISFEEAPPSVAEIERRIGATLTRFPWLVCEDDQGRVAGYVYAGAHKERLAYRWSVDVSAYVREDCRGQRVGQRLYARLFELLAGLGYYQAFAGITLPNAASVGLHESVGFTKVGVCRAAGFKLGAWYDVGWWQRPLREPVAGVAPAEPTPFTPHAAPVGNR